MHEHVHAAERQARQARVENHVENYDFCYVQIGDQLNYLKAFLTKNNLFIFQSFRFA